MPKSPGQNGRIVKQMRSFFQQEEQETVVLGRRVVPPYSRATVTGDVQRLIKRQRNDTLLVNEVIQYIEYLKIRYPKLRPLPSINKKLFEGDELKKHLEVALGSFGDFVKGQRVELTTKHGDLLNRLGYCQVCSFVFRPLLQVHHVVPLTEGGDNQLVTVLCPTCHKLIHHLIAVKAKRSRQELLMFDWLTRQKGTSEWWVRANANVNALVNVYFDHLTYLNFEVFLQEYAEKIQELPFLIFTPVVKQVPLHDLQLQ